MSLSAPRWSISQFEHGAAKGVAIFRDERINETRENYVEHFLDAQGAVRGLLTLSSDLTTLGTTGGQAVANPRYMEALRYTVAPPISADDLATVSDVREAHWIYANQWPTVVRTVLVLVDDLRFPWLSASRAATDGERDAAVLATTSLIAARRVMTDRANESKNIQEEVVKASLRAAGFSEVPSRPIGTLRSAPSPGQFCGESMLGTRKADIVVGLWDDRILAIECKVSNSALNSVKRIKNDAAVKAKLWIQEFGDRLIVPAAVIAGVFKPGNLLSAQADGLTIWWSHDIAQMIDWINKAR